MHMCRYIYMYVHLLSLCMYVCVLDVYVWYVHICIEQENCVGLWRVVFCLCTHTACVCVGACACACLYWCVCQCVLLVVMHCDERNYTSQ